jgi:hypothetical protein
MSVVVEAVAESVLDCILVDSVLIDWVVGFSGCGVVSVTLPVVMVVISTSLKLLQHSIS